MRSTTCINGLPDGPTRLRRRWRRAFASSRTESRAVPSTAIIDPGLPTLPEVFDPATIGEQLGCVLPADWGSVQDVQLRIVKHHPGSRCTFEIAVRTARGERSLLGKVYASDRSDVYRAMEAIRRSGFGPEHAFSIPEPLAYVPELQLLLQEKVEGPRDRKSTRLNSSHSQISYAVFCLKKQTVIPNCLAAVARLQTAVRTAWLPPDQCDPDPCLHSMRGDTQPYTLPITAPGSAAASFVR